MYTIIKDNIIRFIACKQVKTKMDFEKTDCDLLFFYSDLWFSIHYLRDAWINYTVYNISIMELTLQIEEV